MVDEGLPARLRWTPTKTFDQCRLTGGRVKVPGAALTEGDGSDMAGLIEKLTEAGKGPWLDYTGYAGNLLARGEIPWTAIDAAVAWFRQAQGLLRSSVAAVPVEAIAAAWLNGRPDLRQSMAARSRTIHPLRILIADAEFRGHLKSLFEALGASVGALPVVAVVPSPRCWVSIAYSQAFPDGAAEIDDDVVDSAAAFIADFLRELPQTMVAGLLLDESAATLAVTATTIALYQPVLNVASHYRWQVGILAPQPGSETAAGALDFWILPAPVPVKTCGIIVPESFWSGAAAPERPPGGFRYAPIPADARPESVLERLGALR
jgi:hypothetical protein